MIRRRQLFLLLRITFTLLVGLLTPCLADTRIALVIGNSNYKNTPALTNPANDAHDVAQALAAMGFKVTLKLDAGKREMDQTIAQFARDSTKADAALFYYAGHGMQFQGRNFVMPVDAELQDEISLRYELTAIDDVKEALQRSRGVKIMILDSCRNNPLADRFVRSISVTTRDVPKVQGFARPEQTRGMIIVYATQADDVANDGAGRNSPFSAAFLKEIQEPGLEIGAMFRRMGQDVYEATGGRQSPELSISMAPEFYLNQAETDQAIWARIRRNADAATLREFLTRYPNSFYAPDAAARLDLIERDAQEKAADQRLSNQQRATASESERLAQEKAERERIATEARAREQELSAKLADAEAARIKLASELAQREAAQVQDDARRQADRDRAEKERQQREADLRQQIAQMQASQEEKDRLIRDALEKEREKQTAAAKESATNDQAAKAMADQNLKADADRAQALKAEIAQLELQAAQARAKAAADEAKALEAGQAAASSQTKVALAEPGAPDKPILPEIRIELRRLGCFSGADVDWGAPEMRRGIAKYVQYAKLGSAPDAPTAALLDDLRGRRDRLCPLECSAREMDVGGRCVAKTCGRNEMLNSLGRCVARPAPREIARVAPPAAPAASSGKGHCFVFNGNQYCE